MTDNQHKYEKYRPAWCEHPAFTDVDHCFGLVMAADDGTLEWFLGDRCWGCEYHQDYNKKTAPPTPPPPRLIKEGVR